MADSGAVEGSNMFQTLEEGSSKDNDEKLDVSEASIQEASTDPDSLKNTPSNIAKLEDVIEHCKARRKYLACTKSPSDGEDVRWYFCKLPLAENQLAASVPRTAIIGKSEYFRFSMRDSLALEASFLQREEELLTWWWQEYAECSAGPGGSSSSSADKRSKSICLEANQSTDHHSVEEERVGVPVKGGLYEVDLPKRHCFPVYWSGENRRVLRGHWFARKRSLDWLPIREDVAEQLELAYRCQVWRRRTFQPSGLFAARVDLQGGTEGLHALFTGDDDTWEAWLATDKSGFSDVIGMKGHGIKLRRGFSVSGSAKPTQDELRQQKEEEMDDYCSQVPVRHLVFMVHGIGQRLEKANLVDDVGDFRQLTASLAERHLTYYQRNTQRVLFIPCQWRKGLKLDGESAVEKCTLEGVHDLRVMLSATAHDVLYYMSPIYCQNIIDSVSNQLNRLYLKFLKRNASYDGKVSIYGHSLGSVLSYDILCQQGSWSSPLSIECMYEKNQIDEESKTERGYQPSKSHLSVDLEGHTAKGDGGAAVVPDTCSSSQSNSEACEEENSEALLQSRDHSSTLDVRDHQFSEISADIDPLKKISSSQGDNHEPCVLSSPLSCQNGDSLELNANIESQDAEGDKDVGVGILKLIEIKDTEISLLREKVSSLKAKIAELELKHNSPDSVGGTDIVEKPLYSELHQDESPKRHRPHINYTKLKFKVDTFFAVGSPLGVFLALRNVRIGLGRGQDYWKDEKISEEMPACRQMFNIFHPYDPVAYRVEPLVCKEYISKRPVIIPYHRGGKRLHIGLQEFSENLAARSEAVRSHFNSMKAQVVDVILLKIGDKMQEAKEEASVEEKRTYGALMMERVTGSQDGRIDHVIQDKTFEHPYLQAISAHTNYWRDPDTALFILKHLYRDVEEEPDTPENSDGQSKTEKALGLIYERDALEEDLPLTFSDRNSLKVFTRKVRRSMKRLSN